MKCLAFLLTALALACSPPSEPVQDWVDPTLRLADIGKACTADSPATFLTGPALDSLPWPRAPLTNAMWIDAALTIEGGVGGVFANHGVYYLWLTDTTKRVEAITGLTAAGLIGPPFTVESTVALQARWDFAQLGDWYAYLIPKLVPSLRSSGIDEANNRLRFGVADEAGREQVEAILQTLDLPCNLVALYIAPVIGW